MALFSFELPTGKGGEMACRTPQPEPDLLQIPMHGGWMEAVERENTGMTNLPHLNGRALDAGSLVWLS